MPGIAVTYLDTEMNFSGPIEGRARVDAPDWSRTNMALEPHEVQILDARPRVAAGSLSIDREGFLLATHATTVDASAELTADTVAAYLDDLARFLKELTGAALVLSQGKGLLRRVNVSGGIGPSRWVHRDYTTAAAYRWRTWVEGWQQQELAHFPRFAILQTWRCLTPPPSDNTLVLCDASSIDESDCIVFDAAVRTPYDEPGNVFESQFSRFNPDQRWFYFPDLRPDEVIVFKGFDSDDARYAQPLHNSVDLPGTATRVSIEARFFAFFA